MGDSTIYSFGVIRSNVLAAAVLLHVNRRLVVFWAPGGDIAIACVTNTRH
jgi:hypothetical protein